MYQKFINALYQPDDTLYMCGPHPGTITYKGAASALKTPTEYVCLNPTPGAWLASEIYPFRNFLVEFDNNTLDDQHTMISTLEKFIPIRSVTYSGSKSLHAVISVSDDFGVSHLPGERRADLYRATAKALHKFCESKVEQFRPKTGTFIDPSNCNANRLTRCGGAINRHWKEPGRSPTLQELLKTGDLISVEELTALISSYAPKPYNTVRLSGLSGTFDKTIKNQTHLRALWKFFNIPETWAGPNGNYHHIFKYTLWAIEATGVEQAELENYLLQKTYPYLKQLGYDAERALEGIRRAYIYKRFT